MKPYIWRARVYYEDTDTGGIVYYANYLKFMERARTEWLRSIGTEQDQLSQDMNVLFAVQSVNIEYKKPARFNDSLCITVEPYALKPARISFKQSITKKNDEACLLTSAVVNIVCLSADNFSPRGIPKKLFSEIDREIKGVC